MALTWKAVSKAGISSNGTFTRCISLFKRKLTVEWTTKLPLVVLLKLQLLCQMKRDMEKNILKRYVYRKYLKIIFIYIEYINSILCNIYRTKLFNKFKVMFNQLIEDFTMVYNNSSFKYFLFFYIFIFYNLLKYNFSKVPNFFI